MLEHTTTVLLMSIHTIEVSVLIFSLNQHLVGDFV
jgi:hypothetical protein